MASNVAHASVDRSHNLKDRYGGPILLQALTVSARHWSFDTASSGIQDSVAFSVEKFGDLLHFISLNANFIQRFAKVLEKPIEMPVI